MSNLFDPFMVMKMTEENSVSSKNDDHEADALDTEELETKFELLREELTLLEEKLMLLESNEPDDVMSNSYNRCNERHNTMVEFHISDVQVEIESLEKQLE